MLAKLWAICGPEYKPLSEPKCGQKLEVVRHSKNLSEIVDPTKCGPK